MIRFLHLLPKQLGLNGEAGNVECLMQRLTWAGIESDIVHYHGGDLPKDVSAVFIGSGTLSGALSAVDLLRPVGAALQELANRGVSFLALGLGWEILGQSIVLVDNSSIAGISIYPSTSQRVSARASKESYGFDSAGRLCAGYANHSAEITLLDGEPLITIERGFGNSSLFPAPQRSDEGLRLGSLWAARLNGPLFPINPQLADSFLEQLCEANNIEYLQQSDRAKEADNYALRAREGIRDRLKR